MLAVRGPKDRIDVTVMNFFSKHVPAHPTSPRAAGAGQTRAGQPRAGKPRGRRHLATLGLAAMALAGVGIAGSGVAIAQDTDIDSSGPQSVLSLPSEVTLLGHSNPNLRRATAVVNGDIVTGTDVDQRLALIVAANGNKVAPEETARLRLQVLRNLIDETLEIQEAKTAEITIDDAEVNETFTRVAQENFHQTVPALDAYLAKIGSSSASLKRQIRGELAWQRVLRRNVQPFVNVSEVEVRELLDRMKASKGTEEYRLGEIYLSATPESRTQVAENARQIMAQLKQGGSFVAYARQYSEASTAAVGGDLGWIRLAQLPTELATAARGIGTGQFAGPIELRGGYSIIYLIDKRQVLTADPRDAVLALKQISLNLPANTSDAEATRRADELAEVVKTAHGCGGIDAAAGKIGAQVVANDAVRARDLPPALQQTLLALSLGEATQPFGSQKDGVRVLMLCGRDDPKAASGPSFDELMAQMQDDRVNKRAQMYLRDLRRDAIIEYN